MFYEWFNWQKMSDPPLMASELNRVAMYTYSFVLQTKIEKDPDFGIGKTTHVFV